MRRLTDDRDRARAALAAVALTAGLGAALLWGVAPPLLRPIVETVARFDLVPPATVPKPPTRAPNPSRAPRPNAAAAPPNRVSRATAQVVVPTIVPPPPPLPPPPLVVAPVAAAGEDRSSGAALAAGPGTGAGGDGRENGGGDSGDGNGGGGVAGGGGGDAVQIAGRITGRDYPLGPLRAHIEGQVTIHYAIDARGRVQGCRIVRSSGNADLDATTCRLVTRRFRFRPARDANGRKIADELTEDHTWVIDGADPRDDD